VNFLATSTSAKADDKPCQGPILALLLRMIPPNIKIYL